MSVLPQTVIDDIVTNQYQGDQQAFLDDLRTYFSAQEAAVKTPSKTALSSRFEQAPTIIDLKNVSRTYKLGRKNIVTAVKDVSLQVKQGEIVALTGPSGSGKSTLMQLIGGLDTPTGGDITVDGHSLKSLHDKQLSRYRNQTVGFVFQFFYLQPFLKVDKNIEVPLMFARTKRTMRQPAVRNVIDAVSLSDRAAHLPKELSGGQMQRVAIARALVNQPKILLADEPTGNLDSITSASIMQLLQQIRDTFGTTMVIVTHDVAVANMADRIIRLSDGVVEP